MAKSRITCICVSRYADTHNKPRLAGKWFWELQSSDGTVWGMGTPSKRLADVYEWATTFSCFSGLRIRMSPKTRDAVRQLKLKAVTNG